MERTITEGLSASDCVQLLQDIDKREKEEIERLRDVIKQAQSIEEQMQQRYVALTGRRCL